MARKTKIGIDYFPHKCAHDDELEYIIALHKETGYYIYFRLLEKIYNDLGYYTKWDKKNAILFANKINVDINKLNDVINDCLSEHLFDKSLHKKHNILTSKGIQVRYFEAIDRRKEAEIINEYILIKDDYINTLNVNINRINVDGSTQSKVEESIYIYNKFYDEQIAIADKNHFFQYSKFVDFIFKNNPTNKPLNKVLNLSDQIKQETLNNWLKEHNPELIKSTILNLENYTKKNYKSFTLTINEWLKKK